ncbi:putative small multidrug resistance protein [Helicobacter canis]|uniref:Spermidine export protein MdtJ n=2 Tax=Helicobacter TaxID=209 RepID=A0A377J421_9HELI|nr:putative small multidrug resistance protein [Helicobacter canis]
MLATINPKLLAWLWLVLAIITEVLGSSFLKLAQSMSYGFLVTAFFICVSYYFIGLAIKQISVSVAYAMWEVLGVICIVLIGIWYFDENLALVQYAGIVCAVVGILLINFGEVSDEDSVLGEQCGSVANFVKGTTDKVANLPQSLQSSHSPTAIPRILEEEKGAECENPTQILESHSSFTKQAENLESTFDKNAELQKVDSKKNAQSLNTPQNKKAEVVFDNHAAGGRIFDEKAGVCSGEQGDKTWLSIDAASHKLPAFSQKANAQNLESTFCTSHTSKPSALSFVLLSAGLIGVVALSLLGYVWHSTPAMLGFAFVCIAAVLDVVANLLLKASNGFSKLGYGLGAVAVVIGAFYLLMLALDSMELAVAYSSWGAIGIIGTIAGGRILFGERLNAIGYVGVVLVIAAVGLLHEII